MKLKVENIKNSKYYGVLITFFPHLHLSQHPVINL